MQVMTKRFIELVPLCLPFFMTFLSAFMLNGNLSLLSSPALLLLGGSISLLLGFVLYNRVKILNEHLHIMETLKALIKCKMVLIPLTLLFLAYGDWSLGKHWSIYLYGSLLSFSLALVLMTSNEEITHS